MKFFISSFFQQKPIKIDISFDFFSRNLKLNFKINRKKLTNVHNKKKNNNISPAIQFVNMNIKKGKKINFFNIFSAFVSNFNYVFFLNFLNPTFYNYFQKLKNFEIFCILLEKDFTKFFNFNLLFDYFLLDFNSIFFLKTKKIGKKFRKNSKLKFSTKIQYILPSKRKRLSLRIFKQHFIDFENDVLFKNIIKFFESKINFESLFFKNINFLTKKLFYLFTIIIFEPDLSKTSIYKISAYKQALSTYLKSH